MKKNSLILILLFITSFSFANAETSLTTDSRIKTLVFNENEVYELKFFYGYQSFIEFSNDEEISLISLGDSYAWQIKSFEKKLFIKPLQINAQTNMTIITDKRVYQFEISSDSYDGSADEELLFSLRFFYPKPGGVKTPSIPKTNSASVNNSNNLKNNGFSITNKDRGVSLNFDYYFAGLDDAITPMKVFDDGLSTFFQFKNDNLVIPTISSVDLFGNETELNYETDGEYISVDTTAIQFTLRLDSKLICIFNQNAF